MVFIHPIQVQHHQKSNSKVHKNLKQKFWSGLQYPKVVSQHHSSPEQQQAVTQTTYLNARLMPFIEKYHHKKKLLFWPDLARSHYALKVIEYLEQFCISPQNCPQARPVETLWSILEQMIYAGAWEAKNINQLKKRIMKKLNELDIKVVQSMFLDIRKQLRQIADKGLYEACSF